MSYFCFALGLGLGLAIALFFARRNERQLQLEAQREGELLKSVIRKNEENHQRKVERLLDAIPEPFFSLDAEGRMIRFNQAAATLFRGRAISNRSFQQVFLDGSVCQLIKKARETGKGRAAVLHFPQESPFSVHLRGQRSSWEIEVRPHSILQDAGEYQIMMRDVTAERQADQVRQDFVANASHELRTPLSIIVGYLENLLEPGGLSDRAMAEKMLTTMDRHVERISRLVEEMLVISRLESPDAGPLNVKSFSLSDCVADVTERLELLVEKQGATIVADCADIQLKGDPFYWTQILFNLVENALKQNAAQPVTVTIRARKLASGEIEILVTDDGIGIPSDDLPFIFKRFFRVEKHHGQGTIAGTGLGLSIVKRAVEAHHGSIAASSTPGKETTFQITVPA